MQISLIVATLDRPECLQRLLQSLDSQSHRAFDVIVIDQSSGSAARTNEALLAGRTFPIRYQRIERRGLSHARNVGLSFAAGDIIGFPDDDCWYAPCLLETVVARFKADKTLGFLAGIYSEPGRENSNFPRKPRVIDRRLAGTEGICSVGLFFQAVALRTLRFDELLGAGAELPFGEEADLVLRAVRIGFVGQYDPSIVVYHKIERMASRAEICGSDSARAYLYYKNRGLVRIKWRLVVSLGVAIVRCLYGGSFARSRLQAKVLGVTRARRQVDCMP